jgi:uncharacterized protein (TIGR01244 family)
LPPRCCVSQGIYCVKRHRTIDNFSSLAHILAHPYPRAAAMNKITYVTPCFAVTGALEPADFAAAAALGFKAIVSNLPDGESSRHPGSAAEANLAAEAGLGFRHIPATKHDVLSDRVIDGINLALSDLQGPVLAHCASGLRSALAWAGAAARSQPAGCVLAALEAAGFNLAAIREELEQQRGRPHPAAIPAALDCRCGERSLSPRSAEFSTDADSAGRGLG